MLLLTLLIAAQLALAPGPDSPRKELDGALRFSRAHAKPGGTCRLWCRELLANPDARLHRNFLFELPEPLASSFSGVVVHPDAERQFTASHSKAGLATGQFLVRLVDRGPSSGSNAKAAGYFFALEFSGLEEGEYSLEFLSAKNTDLSGEPVPSNFKSAQMIIRIEPLTIYPKRDLELEVGRFLSTRFLCPAGSGAVSWRVIAGELPEGLEINKRGGFRGTVPHREGGKPYRFSIQAMDASGDRASRTFSGVLSDFGPCLQRVAFEDLDGSRSVSVGDALVLDFDEEVVLGTKALESLEVTRDKDFLGLAPTLAIGGEPDCIRISLGRGARLDSLGISSGLRVLPDVHDGILDRRGHRAEAASLEIAQDLKGHLEFGLLTVGEAIAPLRFWSPPFSPREFKVHDLPEGVTLTTSATRGAYLAGTPIRPGWGSVFVYERVDGDWMSRGQHSYEVREPERLGDRAGGEEPRED